MKSKRICYNCLGITEQEHLENIAFKFFTQDMEECYECNEVFTSSCLYEGGN